MTGWDSARWHDALETACRRHSVPGGALAVLVDDEVHVVAAGVVNVSTQVEATPDSVFHLGSLTKPYTARCWPGWRRPAG